MIELKIIESPDQEIIGSYVSKRQEINIGRSYKNDLIINDAKVSKYHIVINNNAPNILCHSISDQSYLSNSKKIIGSKNHKVNDYIQIGDTKIQVINCLPAEIIDITNKHNYLDENRPDIMQLLNIMEQELVNIELEKK